MFGSLHLISMIVRRSLLCLQLWDTCFSDYLLHSGLRNLKLLSQLSCALS